MISGIYHCSLHINSKEFAEPNALSLLSHTHAFCAWHGNYVLRLLRLSISFPLIRCLELELRNDDKMLCGVRVSGVILNQFACNGTYLKPRSENVEKKRRDIKGIGRRWAKREEVEASHWTNWHIAKRKCKRWNKDKKKSCEKCDFPNGVEHTYVCVCVCDYICDHIQQIRIFSLYIHKVWLQPVHKPFFVCMFVQWF